ncbi:MAG: MFS transporter [Rhodospirillales bacterium]|nr:MFS transporter [Rhodospirillales bacterium]
MIPFRLAAFYASSFMMLGIHLIFWPLWLSSKGLSVTDIGLLLALGIASKLIANPLVGHIADRLGQRKRVILILSTLAFLAFLLFPLADSFAAILLLHLLFLALWSPAMPLMESLVMHGVASRGLDYGRIRLWGSVAFVFAAIGIGFLLKDRSTDVIYLAIAGSLLLVVLSAIGLPDMRPPRSADKRPALLIVIRDRRFVLFLVGTALIQSSHAVYYGFGSIHWKTNGISEDWIGLLWAVGVLAEIVLFTYATKILSFIGPARLIAVAGCVGLVRWPLTALTLDIAPLVGLQVLHALTFGATHIGAMHFIQSRIDPSLSATAQSLYSGIVMGAAMSLAAFASGHLYATFHEGAYLAMGGISAAGALIVYVLRRK